MPDNVAANSRDLSGPRLPPASLNENNPLGWAKTNLFGSWGNAITTVLLIAALAYIVPGFLNWAFFNAVFQVDSDACRAAEGACWGLIGEKWRIMLFGRYPIEELWRSVTATFLIIFMIAISINPERWSRTLGA
ncbi:MAG: amino acid ABC transporter permease, partial [Pseudomonadota bacterium]